MIKAFSSDVKQIQQRIDSRKSMYVKALCDNFVHECIREESTIDDLNKGLFAYHTSLSDFSEFKGYCDYTSPHPVGNKSGIYSQVVKNAFNRMQTDSRDPYILKSFANNNSKLGYALSMFMRRCTRWYIVCSLTNPGILNCRETFLHFCSIMNSNGPPKRRVSIECNLFMVYFEDYFYNLNTNAQQVRRSVQTNSDEKRSSFLE